LIGQSFAPAELAFDLDEIGIIAWDDGKSEKCVVISSMADHPRYHHINGT
jgi:hypothetical protein